MATKVSIITPCYNAATYIQATIQSIQQQTLTDWELLIVDDGSTDNSADIVRRAAKEDNRILLIQKANGGTASARKLGLEQAQGEYIQFLDADDRIENTKLERQTTLMDQEQLDISYTDWCFVSQTGQKGKIQGLHCNLFRLLSCWGTFGTLPIHSFVYRHAFLQKNNITIPTHIKEREDWDFHIETFSAKPKAKRIAGYCGAFYTLSPSGKTTGNSMEKIQIGSFKYLIYKIHNVRGYKRLLLYIRFSTALCTWALQKYRYDYQPLKSRETFRNNNHFEKAFVIGLLLLPISSIITIVKFIIDHIKD